VSTTITDRTTGLIDELARRQLEIDAAKRGKAPTNRIGRVRLRFLTIDRHCLAEDPSRLGFHGPAMPRCTQA
jgi:hypothetical protein